MSEENKSLISMLSALKILEKEIDNSDEITLEQCEQHFGAIKDIDQKVDRLLAFMDLCKQNSATYAARAEELMTRSESWDKKLASLEKYALFLVNRYPEVQWRGSDRVIAKKYNPPYLKCDYKKSFTSQNVIPEEFLLSIPEKYKECKVIWLLKNDVVKDDLKSGHSLDFAKLERRESLAINAKLKEDKAK